MRFCHSITLALLTSRLMLSPLAALAAPQAAPQAVGLGPESAGDRELSPTPATATFSVSLAQALAMARAHSFTVAAAGSRVDAATARLRAAGALPGSTLSLAHAFGKDTGGFDEDILLTQTFEIGKAGSRVKGARLERSAALLDRAGAGVDLDFAVKSAYYDAVLAEVETGVAQSSLQSAQTFQAAAQAQLTAGDAPRSNLLRSNIELSRAKSALAAARSERGVRLELLKSLLGLPANAEVALDAAGPSDEVAPPSIVATFDMAELQTLAERQRADLRSAGALAAAKAAAVRSARAQNIPDAFVEARRAAIAPYKDLPNGSSVRVGLTFPLLDFGRTRAGVAEAKAAADEGRNTLAEARRVARLDVTTTYQKYLGARDALTAFDTERLAQSKELLEMAHIGYEHGASTYLEVLDAQNVYNAEQLDLARARAAWRTARADLQRAVGGQLP